MSYKYSTGSVYRGDIYFEDDRDGAATYIDFGQDTITLRPSGTAQLYVEDGKVGIGTTAPGDILHIQSNASTTRLQIENTAVDGDPMLMLQTNGNTNWYMGIDDSDADKLMFMSDGGAWDPAAAAVTFTTDGKVGIGTISPTTALDIHHNPTALSNDTGGGDVVTFGTGNLTAGKLYFLNSSGAWTETDADAIATSDGLLGIALGSAPSNGVLLRGFFDATTYLSNFISGLPVYLSTTAANMDTTQPSGTGDIVRCVGYCTNTANVIYFSPESIYLELS